MKLLKLLANLGYGSRKQVAALFDQGRVRDGAGAVLAEGADLEPSQVRIDGEPIDPLPGVIVMLHKPAGCVCSTEDAGPLVYDLLPPRFRRRSPLLATVGRLDRDTTGLLLLTDDGALLHRIASPKTHLAKTYEASLARDLRGDEAQIFASGTLMLRSERTPLLPAELEPLGPRRARIVVREGRYHQVRRMFAAVGNHVEALHRSRIGCLVLGDLEPGAWRVLGRAEVETVLS